MSLDDLLNELATLNHIGTTDLISLKPVLDRRADLIQQISHIVQAGGTTSEQRELLRQAQNAGNALLRHLILSRHVLARELSQLQQEHQLWNAFTVTEARTNGLDVAG